MATGLYRIKGNPNSAQVLYGNNAMPIPESKYRNEGYQPPFEALPWESDYKASHKDKPKKS